MQKYAFFIAVSCIVFTLDAIFWKKNIKMLILQTVVDVFMHFFGLSLDLAPVDSAVSRLL